MDNKIPTAEEFNRMMNECVEYKKLIKLKEDLKWFKNKIGNMNIKKLLKVIDKRIDEIPNESKSFNTQVHGQTNI
jgi:chemotaxis regulatin CheY-phosphate phosphatase CheZ